MTVWAISIISSIQNRVKIWHPHWRMGDSVLETVSQLQCLSAQSCDHPSSCPSFPSLLFTLTPSPFSLSSLTPSPSPFLFFCFPSLPFCGCWSREHSLIKSCMSTQSQRRLPKKHKLQPMFKKDENLTHTRLWDSLLKE